MCPKTWRLSKNLTQAQLAKLMDLKSEAFISDIERGVKPASGRIQRAYYKLSKGKVTPADFEKLLDTVST